MPDHLLPLLENPVIIDIFCVCDSILYKVSSLGCPKHEEFISLNDTLNACNIVTIILKTFYSKQNQLNFLFTAKDNPK